MKKNILLFIGLCMSLFHACRVGEEPSLPPELEEVAVADISTSSAALVSAVRKSGNQDIHEHGFVYSEREGDNNGTKTTAGAIDPTQPTPISFREAIDGLKLNTTYYVRAYAVTREGTVYSTESSFRTLNIIQPGISTDGAEGVIHDFARLKGTVTSEGTYPVTQYGIVWGPGANPDVSLPTQVAFNGAVSTFPLSFAADAAGLSPGTTYHFRAYVIADNVVSYGADMTFTTSDIYQPGIRTDNASEISVNAARLGGTVLSKGTFPVSEYGICWSTNANPTTSDSKFTQNGDVASVPASFNGMAYGLSPNTRYYYRAYVISNNVTTYGADMNFVTPNIVQPQITTGGVDDIAVNSARLSGTLNAGGSFPISEYGVCWSTSANPTTSNSRVSEYGNVTSFPKNFTITAGGLNATTTYYYRAYVISNGVTTYGGQQSFSTPAVYQPGVSTGGAGGITTNSARLDGSLTSGGSYPISEYGVCWSTSANPTTSNSRVSEYGNVTSFPRSFTITAGGLNPNTTYYYRAYVISNGVTTYGGQQSFSTPAVYQPGVNTGGAGGITTNSARLDGSLTSAGSYPISEYGVCWGTSANPTTSNSRAAEYGNVNSFPRGFTVIAGGLNASTTYHYRAYVISNGVTVYGADQTFRTADALPPGVTTVGAARVNFSFRFDGRIDSGGSYGITEYGICYSATVTNPTIAQSRLSAGGSPGSFPYSYSFTLNNPTSTYYYYRAYVISNGVVYYGNTNTVSSGKD